MIDLLFEMICNKEYNFMVIMTQDGILYGVPCDDEKYPLLDKKVKISSSTCTLLSDNDYEHKGIMIEKTWDGKLEINIGCMSHDGFCCD